MMSHTNCHGNDENVSSSRPSPGTQPGEQQCETLTEQLAILRIGNDTLTSQLKEVTKMNTHWQRYDTQREEHVLKLTRANTDLQQSVASLRRQLQEQRAVSAERKAHEGNHGNATSSGLRDNLVGNQEDRIVALMQQIQKLKEKILYLEIGRASRKKEEHEQSTLLREQINICIEDFKQERKDREKSHAENEKLRERLARAEQQALQNNEQMYVYQEQIENLQEQAHTLPPFRPAPSRPPPVNIYDEGCCYPADRQRKVSSSSRKAYRHPLRLDNNLVGLPTDVEVDDIPDVGRDRDVSQDQIDGDSDGTNNEEDTLECPGCLAPFGINMHADLLDHINTCLK